jgi:hypothetical protein
VSRNRYSANINIELPASVSGTTLIAALALALESDAIKQLPGSTEIVSMSVDFDEEVAE